MKKNRKLILDEYVDDSEGFNLNLHSKNISTMKHMLRKKSSVHDSSHLRTGTQSDLIKQNSGNILLGLQLGERKFGYALEIMKEQTNQIQNIYCENHLTEDKTHEIVMKAFGEKVIVPRKKLIQLNFKDMITRHKVQNLCKKFIKKIRMNNTETKPIQYSVFEEITDEGLWLMEGYIPHPTLVTIKCLLTLLIVFSMIIAYSLQAVFVETRNLPIFMYLQYLGIIYFVFEIVYKSITVKVQSGKRIKKISEILRFYWNNSMVIDFLNLIILIATLFNRSQFWILLRLFIITKWPQCMDNLEKLEAAFIKTYYNEQYWSLAKVVIFNFCFAHIIAIFLSAMTQINQDNWYKAKGIIGQEWFPKYIWSYYWGVNIMLTVGFGDLSATNHNEALCLIFIEIFSVMCLAYNINWIGTLISNIRSQDLEKQKNFKTFRQLSDKYKLPDQLEWRIFNYIDQSVNIRKKFNIEQQGTFVKALPSNMKKEYLKETNKPIFQELPFFSGLINRSLYSFAQNIQMIISHPEQLLRKIDDGFNLLILREGSVGFTAKKRNCGFNDVVIDRVKISSNQKPFILGLEFLTRSQPIYETKSLEYSVIYSLPYEQLIKILRDSQMDYIHFCFLRDKNKSTPDEFEVLDCDQCKRGIKHTKFTCPKLHFIPIKQMSIYKDIHHSKTSKNKRNQNKRLRILLQKQNSLIQKAHFQNILKQSPYLNEKKSKNGLSNLTFGSEKILKQIKQRKLEITQKGSNSVQNQTDKNMIYKITDIFKQEFEKFKRSEFHEDEVWSLDCDKINNYKEYFPEGNAQNLEYMFDVNKRLKALQQQKQNKMSSHEFSGQQYQTISYKSQCSGSSIIIEVL